MTISDEVRRTLEAARDYMASELDPREQLMRRFDPVRAAEHDRKRWNIFVQLQRLVPNAPPRVAAPDVLAIAPREAAPMPQADGC